ncbi:sn-glycerol-3-phosphate dehydrogenase subunit C [Actinobacillus pleuropneumoniae]|nr:sn-glycerol-3-phosphate dehydrogenase subunit C [Actinobacillus pleuropneumoniae]
MSKSAILSVRARNRHVERQNKPLIHKLRDAVLSNTDIMGTMNTPFAPIVNTITGLKATRFLLEKTLKVSQHRTLPKYSFGSFRNWYMKKRSETPSAIQRASRLLPRLLCEL